MVKATKGVPPPARRGRHEIYPWRTMKVKESFFVKEKDAAVINIGNANARYAPKRFVSSKENKGTRVWRVA